MQRIFGILFLIIGLTVGGKLFAQADLLAPDLRSVALDPETGGVIIKWENANDANITHTQISRQIYGGTYAFNPIGEVAIPGAIYTDLAVSNIASERQTYRIRAKNATQYSPITSMHITTILNATYDVCANEIELRWTPYKQFYIDGDGLGNIIEPHEPEQSFNNNIKYEVWGVEGGNLSGLNANAVKLGNTIKGTVDTLRNLTENTTYYLFVKILLPNGDIATTYHAKIETVTRREPAYMNIDSIVTINGSNRLYFNIDNTTQLDTFALYRSGVEGRPIRWFRGQIPTGYVDTDIQLGLSYNYSLGVFRCGKLLQQSDTVNNVLFFVNNIGQSSLLRWSSFTSEPATYELTRHEPKPELVIYTVTDAFTYTDNIKALLEDGVFRFCYSIKADNGKSGYKKSIARSEIKCTTVEPVVSMPDAIDPYSNITNPVTGVSRNQFGPILSFKDDKYRFTLEIFTKSGVRIFKSNKEFNDALSPGHYWDGRYNGSDAKEDTYIYSLKFEFKDRKPFTQNGTVTVCIAMRNN